MKTKEQKMKDLQTVRRRKLIIQKVVGITQDENLNQIPNWEDWETVWAEKLELFGSEYYAAKQLGEEKTIKFKIRYINFLNVINTTDYRIIFDNYKSQYINTLVMPGRANFDQLYLTREIYDIKDTDTLNDDGMWFIIKAEKSGELDV